MEEDITQREYNDFIRNVIQPCCKVVDYLGTFTAVGLGINAFFMDSKEQAVYAFGAFYVGKVAGIASNILKREEDRDIRRRVEDLEKQISEL